MKKAIVSVTNDLATDQRVQRSIEVLRELGFQPVFVGRLLPGSPEINFDYPAKRFRLWFRKGFLFYANYNLRLFVYLLFKPASLYISNDLDTLLPNFLISKLYRKPLIYDAHEYFTGVPEIENRPLVKKVWTGIEKWIFPKLQEVVTVNESIAALYREQYGKEVKVVRNISDSRLPERKRSREELGLPIHKFIMINQGAGINVDRGMEEALLALNHLPEDVILLIVGSGDAVPGLRHMAQAEGLSSRVIFVPRQPYMEMLQYTLNADVGLSLDKPLSPNYKYSLPNKLFDYIKCGLPLVVSNVIEVQKLVKKYRIGEICEDHNPDTIVRKVLKIKANSKGSYQERIEQAARENKWEKERMVWVRILSKYA